MLSLSYAQVLTPPPGHAPSAAPPPLERFLIACMSFLKGVIDCPSFKGKTAGGVKADVQNEQVGRWRLPRRGAPGLDEEAHTPIGSAGKQVGQLCCRQGAKMLTALSVGVEGVSV